MWRRLLPIAFLPLAFWACRDSTLRTWVAHSAIPLRTTDPVQTIDDLEPLHGVIQGANVVGLGEATHGTREFFQMKHRLVRFLVEREGFSLFAIEASLPEAEAVNRYVVAGEGDAQTALAGLHFWTWDTYEVLALIEWIRSWNTDPAHQQVKFYGFDCQHSAAAAAGVMRYLAHVDAKAAAHFQPPLESARRGDAAPSGLTALDSSDVMTNIQEMLNEFDRNKAAWSAVSGAEEWERNRRFGEVLRQSWDIRNGGLRNRDRYMAENILWIGRREPERKMVVWAHNGHVERTAGHMGGYLSLRLGDGYRSVGFVFGKGQFRAKPAPGSPEVRTITVSDEGAGELDQALLAVSMPLVALDFKSAIAPIHGPISMREFGALAVNPRQRVQRDVARAFDFLIFVRDTTAARPTPTGVRPRRGL